MQLLTGYFTPLEPKRRCSPGGGGGLLWVSSDRDDRMGEKNNPTPPKKKKKKKKTLQLQIKSKKIPGPKFSPQNNPFRISEA